MYFEASNKNPAESFNYLLPSTSEHYCVDFFYHMYGRGMGTFEVIFSPGVDQSKDVILSVSGDQGNIWRHFRTDVSNPNYATTQKNNVRYNLKIE